MCTSTCVGKALGSPCDTTLCILSPKSMNVIGYPSVSFVKIGHTSP